MPVVHIGRLSTSGRTEQGYEVGRALLLWPGSAAAGWRACTLTFCAAPPAPRRSGAPFGPTHISIGTPAMCAQLNRLHADAAGCRSLSPAHGITHPPSHAPAARPPRCRTSATWRCCCWTPQSPAREPCTWRRPASRWQPARPSRWSATARWQRPAPAWPTRCSRSTCRPWTLAHAAPSSKRPAAPSTSACCAPGSWREAAMPVKATAVREAGAAGERCSGRAACMPCRAPAARRHALSHALPSLPPSAGGPLFLPSAINSPAGDLLVGVVSWGSIGGVHCWRKREECAGVNVMLWGWG